LEFLAVDQLVEHQGVLDVREQFEAPSILTLLHVVLLLLHLLLLRRRRFLPVLLGLLAVLHVPAAVYVQPAVARLRGNFLAVTQGQFVVQQRWRLKQRVHRDFEAVVQQLGDDARQERAADLQRRVRVCLNHHHFELLVNHKVVSKNFKGVLVPHRVDLLINGAERVCHEPFHDGKEVPHEADRLRRVILV